MDCRQHVRTRLVVAGGLAALTALTGCAGGDDPVAAEPTATAAPAAKTSTPSPSTTTATPSRTLPPSPRFTFQCYFDDPSSTFDVAKQVTFSSLEAAWAFDGTSDLCTAEFTGGGEFVPTPEEQAVVDVISAHWAQGERPVNAYTTALSTCAATGDDPTTVPQLWAQAAVMICPARPEGADLAPRAAGELFPDGRHVVGQDVAPGAYRTTGEARNCYWERTSGSGATIDNDFITFAPDGATVTVRDGEGFVSEDCGTWQRQ